MTMFRHEDVFQAEDVLKIAILQELEEDTFEPLVYVAAPYAGKSDHHETRMIEEAHNIEVAISVGNFLIRECKAQPVVPHLMTTGLLDDSVPEERDIALKMTMNTMVAVQRYGGFIVAVVEDDATTKANHHHGWYKKGDSESNAIVEKIF